jgi:hypothetical protein
LNLPELHKAKAGDDRNHDSERDHQSLDHMLPICANDELLRGMRRRPARITDQLNVQTGATRHADVLLLTARR